MSREVILMSDVPGLGSEGDVVKVSDGHARNYLLPRGLAAEVTDATRRRLEKVRRDRDQKDERELAQAKELAARLQGTSCNVGVKAGEGGKLFGSVTAAHICEALKLQGIAIDRHQLGLEEPIHELGVFNLPVRVHPQVSATLKVWVVEE
jgi:large subunit ribosomal protein L9